MTSKCLLRISLICILYLNYRIFYVSGVYILMILLNLSSMENGFGGIVYKTLKIFKMLLCLVWVNVLFKYNLKYCISRICIF